MADPIDALVLHIQGSGRVRITNTDGTVTRFSDGRGNTVGRIVHEFGRDVLQVPVVQFQDGWRIVAEVEFEVVG